MKSIENRTLLSSAWPVSIQPPPGFSHPKPQERLATDKIGEELAPDAGIWKIYLDEAKEQDDELVDSKNKNLDMMLLFATLYSAILSAFLIESKKLLQQDPTEVSNGLLLLIAQSQQRIEQGQPQPTLAPIQPVTFSAPSSARWINGLWFLSLALSLSAALVAMLAKEWLTAYNTSRPRSASTYAHLRQSRFNALFKWGALHIIDLLPSMLHLALLLFSIGLIIHLANLDGAVAIVIGVVTGGTFLFYVTAAFLGAIYEFCPFVTQISKYIEQILSFCFKSWMDKKGRSSEQDKRTSDSTTDEDIHALIWLAEHARDPAAGDCSYQALAGLHLTAPKYSTSAVSDTSSNQYELVHGLFQSLCARLSQVLIQQPRELAACQGINVARYANALPKLVDFLEAYSSRPLTNKSKRSAKALLVRASSLQVLPFPI
ncbi:hypothetical protein BDV93DRAFT_491675 [Ceratobasidium sp. AG-I]|nr:hypothetical protein BDV93DRAFT_491675 [Ceratobasidium sp. AG-I]